MRFLVEGRLFETFPRLRIGVLVVEVDNRRGFHDRLESTVEEIRERFPFERPQDHPHIRAWRDAFSKVGISPSKFYSSTEALLRRALKGGPFPKVNPLVDLYNAISLKYLVPIGGHALEPIEGDIHLCFAKGKETFVPMHGGEREVVEEGEVIILGLADQASKGSIRAIMKTIGDMGLEDRVKLLVNQPFMRFRSALSRAKVYLHTQPMEAFGISVVEAMAMGCVPVVPRLGGPWRDILELKNGYYGFSYTSLEEAGERIRRLLRNEGERRKISMRARLRAEAFNAPFFEHRILRIAKRTMKR